VVSIQLPKGRNANAAAVYFLIFQHRYELLLCMNVRGRQLLDDGILRQAIISLHEIAIAEYLPVSLCTQKP
jgi:hypothetical protein